MINICFIVILGLLGIHFINGDHLDRIYQWKHHDNKELNELLQAVHLKCPNITRLYELNERSVKGWPLTVIEFTDYPGKHEFRKLN